MKYPLLLWELVLLTAISGFLDNPVQGVGVTRLEKSVTVSGPTSFTRINYLDALRSVKNTFLYRLHKTTCVSEIADISAIDQLTYAPISGFPGVYVVFSMFKERSLNQTFARMAALKGEFNGIPSGTLIPSDYSDSLYRISLITEPSAEVLSFQDMTRRKVSLIARGHNIPGHDFRLFQTLTAKLKINERRLYGLNAYEDALLKAIASDQEIEGKGEGFFLIGLPAEQGMISRGNPHKILMGHELCHARFYMYPEYRKAVEAFLAEDVMPRKRHWESVRSVLVEYYGEDPRVLLDELQAFLQDDDAFTSQGLFPDQARVLQPLLLRRLRAAGFDPLDIR